MIQKNFKNQTHRILFKFQTSLIKSLATRERINRFDPNIDELLRIQKLEKFKN